MRPPSSLKTIINISYFILIIKWIMELILLLYVLFGGRVRPSSYFPEMLSIAESKMITIILLIIQLFVSALFIYAVKIILKLVSNFNSGKLFTQYQITGLKLAGQLIITVTLAKAALKFFEEATINSRVGIDINFDEGFGSFWLVIAIGLFFYLSERYIFKCKAIKRRKRPNCIIMPIQINLDKILEEKGMKSNELAEIIDITTANLSILKTGKAKAVRFSTLEALCKALECQPGDILEYTAE